MKLLIDTQILIWIGVDSGRIRSSVMDALGDSKNELFVSSIATWEIASKYALGKLPIPVPPAPFVERLMLDLSAQPLPFTARHAQVAVNLPLIHRDPFDRMLICQALAEGLTIATADKIMPHYDVPILW